MSDYLYKKFNFVDVCNIEAKDVGWGDHKLKLEFLCNTPKGTQSLVVIECPPWAFEVLGNQLSRQIKREVLGRSPSSNAGRIGLVGRL